MKRVLSRLMAYSIFEERSLCLEVLQQAGHCSPAVAYQGVQNVVHFIAGLTRTNANGTPNSKEQSPVEVLLHSMGIWGLSTLECRIMPLCTQCVLVLTSIPNVRIMYAYE